VTSLKVTAVKNSAVGKEEKPCKSESRMGTHPSKVQGKWEHKKTQSKEKTKANNQQISGKDLMQRGLMATKRQLMITNQDLRWKRCHLP